MRVRPLRAAAVGVAAVSAVLVPAVAPQLAAASTPASTCTATSYDDFSDISGLQLNGDAVVDEAKSLLLTPAANGKVGTAFTKTPISLASDASFSSHFTFQFGTRASGGGADGMVFVLQTDPSGVGSLGGGMGYYGIERSLGVEFDDHYNPPSDGHGFSLENEPSDSHVGINLNGALVSTPVHNLMTDGIDLADGVVRHAWVDYDGATDTLQVRLSADGLRPSAPLLSTTLDLPGILQSTSAYVGFTSSTGGLHSSHQVNSWQLDGCYRPLGGTTPPTVDAGPGAGGDEGGALALTGTASDASGATPTAAWTATPDTGTTGTCTFADAASPTTTVTCTDEGTYTATLTADNGVGDPASDSTTLTVANAAPTVSLTTPTAGAEVDRRAPVNVTAAVSDPGSSDVLSCEIAWGDGASEPGSITSGVCRGSHTYAANGPATITVTVTDDSGATASDSHAVSLATPLGISVVDAGASEADGVLRFPVTMTGAHDEAVTVSFATTTAGSATPGQDFALASGTATIPANGTSVLIPVGVVNDAVDEPDQTVVITLSNPSSGTLSRATAVGTIVDDDAAPTLSMPSTRFREFAGNVKIPLRLSSRSEKPVSVSVRLVHVTTSGSDVTGPAGATFTLPAGSTSVNVTVTAAEDKVVESTETFRFALSSLTNATGSANTPPSSIVDNERRATVVNPTAVLVIKRQVLTETFLRNPAGTITLKNYQHTALSIASSALKAPDGSLCDTIADDIAGCSITIGVEGGAAKKRIQGRDYHALVVSEPRPTSWVQAESVGCSTNVPVGARDTCLIKRAVPPSGGASASSGALRIRFRWDPADPRPDLADFSRARGATNIPMNAAALRDAANGPCGAADHATGCWWIVLWDTTRADKFPIVSYQTDSNHVIETDGHCGELGVTTRAPRIATCDITITYVGPDAG